MITEDETKTYCDSCAELKHCAEYSIDGEVFWHCDDCAISTTEVRGYFSFDCQPDGYCTFGCGKRPQTVCESCAFHETWLEGTPVPDNWHAMTTIVGADYIGVCDLCEEPF